MGDDASPRRVLGARIRAPGSRGLARHRLHDRLDEVWHHRLNLVVAPAGSGKTTLLSQFSAAAAGVVAWYRAEPDDASEAALAAHLSQSLATAAGSHHELHDDDPVSVEALAAAVERLPGDRVLFVVDDLHTLHGTPAEAALERLVGYLPPTATVLVGSRCVPSFNLSRLRLAEAVLELGADDLRFRSWEVERLFHDFYGEPLSPEDLAELARRTEGWAAGLQLFHLATRGKTPAQRRAVLAALGSRSRLVREYLATNVVDHLEPDLREFLLRTSVLGRLSGDLCDEFLGRPGSAAVLEELERRQIFTLVVDDDGGYRYHEALRTHLCSMLTARLGERSVQAEYRRAGVLLEGAGVAAEALLAYCRGGDDDAAARLLGREGERVVADPGGWLEALPAPLVAADPWLQLASARRFVAAGMLDGAVEAYHRAEGAFGHDAAADVCRRERRGVSLWRHAEPPLSGQWVDLARAATQRDPLAVMRQAGRVPGAPARFVEAAAALLGGRAREGRALLASAAALPDAGPNLLAGARLVSVLGGLLADDAAAGRDAADHALDAQRTGPWLDRVDRGARAAGGLAAEGGELASLQALAQRSGDRWGHALLALADGMAALWAGRPTPAPLRRAGDEFAALGARVLESWARSGMAAAMALAGSPLAGAAGREAVDVARSAASFGAQALAHLALAECEPAAADGHRMAASALAVTHHLQLPDLAAVRPRAAPGVAPPEVALGGSHAPRFQPRPRPVPADPPSVAVRCFGAFELRLAGVAVALGPLKPKARSALRLLAMRAGRPVHRELLLEALWPEADPRAATRSLQVAISSLRQVVEPGTARTSFSLLVREGDTYRLALPADGDADVVRFERAVAESRPARLRGDLPWAASSLRAALDAYSGELLPEEGPAEWVVAERDHYRAQAAEASAQLAEILLECGDPSGAAAACERGLAIDRYRDELWRSLITAAERSGRQAAASRARHHYELVLAELS